MIYLTNVDASENTKVMVEKAAKASGQDVRYIEHPMPPHAWDADSYYIRHYKNGKFNNLHSICGFEKEFDYSKFWAEYRKLK